MRKSKPIINIVAFQEAGGWVAQCLQYDIAAQADSLPDLKREMIRAIVSHILLDAERGRTPFEGLKEAPSKFWKMYGDATPLNEEPLPIDWPATAQSTTEASALDVAPKFKIAPQNEARC